jgi:hypothetical protein
MVEKCEGKRLLGRASVDGRIILRWIIKEWDGRAWTVFICFRTGASGRLL